jgi:hypothetical protein
MPPLLKGDLSGAVHEIARANPVRFPNESAAYRQARNALLAEEIELRCNIERVAELRRALPPGGCSAPSARHPARCAPRS